MSGLSLENFRRLTFDSNTKFPSTQIDGIAIDELAKNLINQGKIFSNADSIHKEGIDGRGTTKSFSQNLETANKTFEQFENEVENTKDNTKGT